MKRGWRIFLVILVATLLFAVAFNFTPLQNFTGHVVGEGERCYYLPHSLEDYPTTHGSILNLGWPEPRLLCWNGLWRTAQTPAEESGWAGLFVDESEGIVGIESVPTTTEYVFGNGKWKVVQCPDLGEAPFNTEAIWQNRKCWKFESTGTGDEVEVVIDNCRNLDFDCNHGADQNDLYFLGDIFTDQFDNKIDVDQDYIDDVSCLYLKNYLQACIDSKGQLMPEQLTYASGQYTALNCELGIETCEDLDFNCEDGTTTEDLILLGNLYKDQVGGKITVNQNYVDAVACPVLKNYLQNCIDSNQDGLFTMDHASYANSRYDELNCEVNAPAYCDDGDGGINYNEKGTVAGTNLSYESVNLEDRCLGDGRTLVEGYCNGNGFVDKINFVCDYQCVDGACVEELVQGKTCQHPTKLGVGINPGTRMKIRGIEKYCNPATLEFNTTKINGDDCSNDYECKSNVCIDGVCVSIGDELKAQTNLLQEIYCWVKDIFTPGDHFDECLEGFATPGPSGQECIAAGGECKSPGPCASGTTSIGQKDCDPSGLCCVVDEEICTDSDGGEDYFVKGELVYYYDLVHNFYIIREDSCLSSQEYKSPTNSIYSGRIEEDSFTTFTFEGNTYKIKLNVMFSEGPCTLCVSINGGAETCNQLYEEYQSTILSNGVPLNIEDIRYASKVGIVTYVDFVLGADLIEYTCDNSEGHIYETSYYNCPNGCVDGACVERSGICSHAEVDVNQDGEISDQEMLDIVDMEENGESLSDGTLITEAKMLEVVACWKQDNPENNVREIPCGNYGDVDGNGWISAMDSYLIEMYVANGNDINYVNQLLENAESPIGVRFVNEDAADVDGNDIIQTRDATIINLFLTEGTYEYSPDGVNILTFIDTFPVCSSTPLEWCYGADINRDGDVDSDDLAFVAGMEGDDTCSANNDWCYGADINRDGVVSTDDKTVVQNNLEKTGCTGSSCPSGKHLGCPNGYIEFQTTGTGISYYSEADCVGEEYIDTEACRDSAQKICVGTRKPYDYLSEKGSSNACTTHANTNHKDLVQVIGKVCEL